MLLDLRPALYDGPGPSVKDRNRGLKPLVAVAEGEAVFMVEISLFATAYRTSEAEVEFPAYIHVFLDANGQAKHPRDAELDLILSGFL